MRIALVLFFLVTSLGAELSWAQQGGSSSFSWRYYRPTNTGIQGDECEALLVDSDGNPWIGGYVASFEEGGFSKFHFAQNRWENYSNVDHQVMGHPERTGIVRVADFDQDELGNLWMSTGRGALFFSPALGPASLVRFGDDNSPMPGGWSRGVEIAPDGTVWFSSYATVWGAGGVSQYDPATELWQVFDNPFGDGKINVQPKTGGGYYVWVNATGLEVTRYNSTTSAWENVPSINGNAAQLAGKNATDPQGNTWLFRWTNFDLFQMKLDCLRPDGTWFNFPAPPFGNSVQDVRAKGPNLVLVVDGAGGAWRFNGSTWQYLGVWQNTNWSYDIDQDASGNVWICGLGGAGRRDAATGQWQRYRITNTGQYEFFNEDLSLGRNGHVYATANAGPGVGGMVEFDGQNWIGYNNHQYGLGYPWPFNGDNSQRVYSRPQSGELLVNPTFEGLHRREVNGWTDMQIGSDIVEDMIDDTLGRLWVARPGSLLLKWKTGWRQISDQGGKVLRLDPKQLGRIYAMSDTTITRTSGTFGNSVWTIEDFPELDPQSDQFKGLVVDPTGMVWVGANTINLPFNSTLIKLNPDTRQYTYYRYGENWPFPGQYLMPVAATPDGRIWFQYDSDFGIDDQGLAYFDGTNVVTFPAPFEGVPQWGSVPHAGILDVEQRKTSTGYELWISCASRGIAVLSVSPVGQKPSGDQPAQSVTTRDQSSKTK